MNEQTGSTAKLFDAIIERCHLKPRDAALARFLGVLPPVISKMRSAKLALGPSMILNIHETTDMPIAEIKHLAGIAK